VKSVQCPVCHNQVFSESFREGEKFPCPHCEQVIEILSVDDEPKAKSQGDFYEDMNWAKGIWKDQRLFLTAQKLAILGELVVHSLEMDKWAGDDKETLQERRSDLARAQSILRESGLSSDLVVLGRTLLDIFINLREEQDKN